MIEMLEGDSLFFILIFLKKLDLKLVFIPQDFKKLQPYTSILQQNGIEVLYESEIKNKLENWLKKNLKYFKYIYFQRPDTTINYIDLVIKYFKGKIIYFPHDLHQVRAFREYTISNDAKKLEE